MNTDKPTGDANKLVIPVRNVTGVINNMLNLMDPRLVDHGRRVAELVYRALKIRGGFEPNQMRDLCMLAFLHDIGAYKTDEIDRLVHFESVRVWQHAVYGYLFIRRVPPLSHLAPVVLFHHADRKHLRYLHASYHELAQIFHVADRIEIMARSSRSRLDRDLYRRVFRSLREVRLSGSVIDLFEEVLFGGNGFDAANLDVCIPGATICGGVFDGMWFTDEALRGYAYMLVHSIEFRSPQTMAHTVGVAEAAEILSDAFEMDDTTKRNILFASLIHDFGKQGVPLEILESENRLGSQEMEVMRTHVALSEAVLREHVNESIVDIAVRHHEKLDGSGYHHGLSGAELTRPDRLLAVADILSALLGRRTYKEPFPQERVLSILGGMRDRGFLDPDIVGMASERIDVISSTLDKAFDETRIVYDGIREDFVRYVNMFENGDGEDSIFIAEALTWT